MSFLRIFTRSLAVVLILTALVAMPAKARAEDAALQTTAQSFAELMQSIDEEFVDGVSQEKLAEIRAIYEEAMSKILRTMDKYSHYSTAKQWSERNSLAEGFGGIGITFSTDAKERTDKLETLLKKYIPSFEFKNETPESIEKLIEWLSLKEPEAKILRKNIIEGVMPETGVRVENVTEKGPAERAGLTEGDLILTINDVKTGGLTAEEVKKHIRGLLGSKVVLKINRNGRVMEFEIVREKIRQKAVVSRMLQNKTGYIKILEFTATGTHKEFERHLKSLTVSGIDRLIIDLRNNPGGRLDSVLDMLSLFVERNSLLLICKTKKRTHEFESSGRNVFPKGKIIILINERSASASEIMAVVLREHRQAIIVGKKSYGKGTVQTVFPLADDSAAAITTARYYSPLKNFCPDGKGITPDIEAEDDPATKEDEVLIKAIKTLN